MQEESTTGDDQSRTDPSQDQADLDLEEYFRDDRSEDESELGRILADIAHTLDCLLRLSITLRNPAPHDRFRSRVVEDDLEHFAEWDTGHVQNKFPDIDANIAQRLGRAAVRRRQYFKYREEHSSKLAEGLDDDRQEGATEGGSTREKATTIASSLPNHLKDSFEEFADLADDSKSDVSRTSYAPSTADTSRLRVPPIPKAHLDGPFKCPFCCMIVSISIRKEWKYGLDPQLYRCGQANRSYKENMSSQTCSLTYASTQRVEHLKSNIHGGATGFNI